MPQIEWVTPNFVQKTLGPSSDLSAMQAWLADPALMNALNLPARKLGADQVARYAATFDNQSKYLIGVYERAGSSLIGYKILELNPVHDRASLHVLIAYEQYRSGRAMDETQIPFYDHVFGTLGVNKLVAEIVADNERTIQRARNNGYVIEGRLVRELKAFDGKGYVDQVRMALFRESWPSVREAMVKRIASRASVAAPQR